MCVKSNREKMVAHSTSLSLLSMMTSSNGYIFRVTGPLCGEFTGPGEFPAQRPVTRSFDVFFDLRPNKRLSKQPWGWWFETPSWSLWHQCNDYFTHFGNEFIICHLAQFLWTLTYRRIYKKYRILVRVICLNVSHVSNFVPYQLWTVKYGFDN